MAVDYEWCCEVVDEHGDIVESFFAESYAEALGCVWDDIKYESRICLVRTCGEGYRSWAYMTNGQLPEYFWDSAGHDTTKVPQRFHREVERV